MLPLPSTRKSMSAESSLNAVSVASTSILDNSAPPDKVNNLKLPSSVPSLTSTK